MIRKLRKKLIAVSMVSLCIVLFCIFGFVGILNYQKMVSDADHTLSILADNDGTFPKPKNDEPDHAGSLSTGSIQPGCRFCFFGIRFVGELRSVRRYRPRQSQKQWEEWKTVRPPGVKTTLREPERLPGASLRIPIFLCPARQQRCFCPVHRYRHDRRR